MYIRTTGSCFHKCESISYLGILFLRLSRCSGHLIYFDRCSNWVRSNYLCYSASSNFNTVLCLQRLINNISSLSREILLRAVEIFLSEISIRCTYQAKKTGKNFQMWQSSTLSIELPRGGGCYSFISNLGGKSSLTASFMLVVAITSKLLRF